MHHSAMRGPGASDNFKKRGHVAIQLRVMRGPRQTEVIVTCLLKPVKPEGLQVAIEAAVRVEEPREQVD